MMEHSRNDTIRKVTFVGVWINVALATLQTVSGILAHSQALVADGLHTFADLISDMVVLLTAHHANKVADDAHPYGHARIETLSSIFLGVALIGVALGMGYRGLDSMANPTEIEVEPFALFFAVLAIFSKEFLYRYTIKAARRIKSTLLESNALHHRSDVFSSVVVVIGVGAQISGISHMDALAAIIVSVMISVMGVHLIKKAFAELIDTSLDQELVDRIKQFILSISGVVAIHRLRSRSMGGLGYIDTEIRVNPRLSVSEAHFISLHIEDKIKKDFDNIIDVSVHIDPVTEIEHDFILNLPSRAELLFSLYSAWEGIEGTDKIKRIHLHYLGRQIDVEVIMPLETAKNIGYDLSPQLHEKAKNISYIGKITIYYVE